MKRVLALTLGVLLLLGLAGCDGREALRVTPSYTTGKGDVVQGGFSVDLPGQWQDQAVWETQETDVTYALAFYEPNSRDAGYGGWLFSLMAIPEEMDYADFPDAQLVGRLTAEDGFVENLVALYPTDVEFDSENEATYQSLYDQIPDILSTVLPTEGYTYARQ